MDSTCQQLSPPEAAASAGHVEQSIPNRFQQLAIEHPTRPAIGSGAWPVTYDELNRAANGLAHDFLARGLSTGDRVAILMRQDGPLIAAVLAALKAGGVVVVFNPGDPGPRLEQILADTGPQLLVTDAPNLELARRLAGQKLSVRLYEDPTSGRTDNPEVPIAPGDPAFLIHTSGSTGRPRGVLQTHRNVLHNVRRLAQGMELSAADRVALLASLSGGQGLSTTWCALLTGAVLCPFPLMEKGVTGLAHWLVEKKITVYVSAASVFRHFIKTLNDDAGFPDVRLVRLASEPATSADFIEFQKYFPNQCILFNTLSSSETGNITQCRLTRNDRIADGRLPVGKPADGMEILLLDESGREVAAGETGEITVRSRYLSPGYWRDETLTAERFATVNGSSDLRLFRSGDLARRDSAGALVFAGRKDDRVKIHGYLVALSEVENVLNREATIERAVVCARPTADDSNQLIAYIVLRAGRSSSTESLRQVLRASLPGYMVPAGFVFLEQFPLNAHGKIDREKLRQLQPAAVMAPSLPEPLSETETLLAGFWTEIFGANAIGSRHNFFDLGGDSLKAAIVAARVHAALGVELDLRAFTDHSTLSELARAIDGLRQTGGAQSAPDLVRASREVPLPLSFAQERIWKYSRTAEASAGYSVSSSHGIRGPLDADVLRESMNYLERRHEILRTTFSEINGRPVQIVQPPGPPSLSLIDFSGTPDPEARATQLFRDEARRPFDLARGPLLRFWLVRLRENEHWLLRINHHLLSDAWSWTVYFRELGLVYEAKRRGAIPSLPEFEPLQYGDYAAWQRETLRPEGPSYRAAIDWWANQFAGKPRAPRLPFRRLFRRRHVDPAEGLIWWGLDPAVSRRLDQIGREAGATYYMVRLTAFAALMSGGRPDLVLGTYVTNRTRVETQNLFGCFANLATLRLPCDPARTFREWLAGTRTIVSEVQARGEIPYEQLREELRGRGVSAPEIRVIFSVSDQTAPVHFGGLKVEWLDRRMESFSWGFNLAFDPHHETRRCRAAFDARLYDPRKVRAWLGRFIAFLDAVSRDPDTPVTRLLKVRSSAFTRPGARTD